MKFCMKLQRRSHFAAGTDQGFERKRCHRCFHGDVICLKDGLFALAVTVTSLVCLSTLFSRGRACHAVQTCRVHTRHGNVNDGAETDRPRGSLLLTVKQNIFLDTRLGKRQHPVFVVLLIGVCPLSYNTGRDLGGGLSLIHI